MQPAAANKRVHPNDKYARAPTLRGVLLIKKINQRLIAVALFLVFAATSSWAATPITQWTFETSVPSGSGTTIGSLAAEMGSGTASGVHADSGTTWSSFAGDGSSHSFSSTNWGIGDYYQFQTATTGNTGIVLDWDQTSSSTGPENFNLYYSTDNSAYTEYTGNGSAGNISSGLITVLLNGSPFQNWSSFSYVPQYHFTVDLSGVSALSDTSAVYFRLQDASTTSENGSTVFSAGTDRVDNFTVSGTPISPYWDTNGATAGIGGTGIWSNTGNPNWSSSSAGTTATVAWDPSHSAIFGGTGTHNYTVTIDNSGAATTVNGGIEFDLDGYTISSNTAADKLIIGTTNTVNVVNGSDTATITAKISGVNGLNKIGYGTLVLSNPNTSGSNANDFTGGVTISGGTLSIGDDSQLGDLGNSITFASGTLKTTAAITSSRSVGLASQGGRIDTNGFNSTFSGVISGTGPFSKVGPQGTLTLSGANTFSGDTKIFDGGQLLLGHSLALQNSTLDYSGYGGSLSFGTLTAATLGGLKGNQNLALTNANNQPVALTVGNNNADTIYTGVLSGDGSLTKVGTGTLTLAPGSNAYTGGTEIQGGTLIASGLLTGVTNSGILAPSAPLNVATYTQTSTGTLQATLDPNNPSTATIQVAGTASFENNAGVAGNLVVDTSQVGNSSQTFTILTASQININVFPIIQTSSSSDNFIFKIQTISLPAFSLGTQLHSNKLSPAAGGTGQALITKRIDPGIFPADPDGAGYIDANDIKAFAMSLANPFQLSYQLQTVDDQGNPEVIKWGQPFDFFDLTDGQHTSGIFSDGHIDFDDMAAMARMIAGQNGGGQMSLNEAYAEIEKAVAAVPEPETGLLMLLGAFSVAISRRIGRNDTSRT